MAEGRIDYNILIWEKYLECRDFRDRIFQLKDSDPDSMYITLLQDYIQKKDELCEVVESMPDKWDQVRRSVRLIRETSKQDTKKILDIGDRRYWIR